MLFDNFFQLVFKIYRVFYNIKKKNDDRGVQVGDICLTIAFDQKWSRGENRPAEYLYALIQSLEFFVIPNECCPYS